MRAFLVMALLAAPVPAAVSPHRAERPQILRGTSEQPLSRRDRDEALALARSTGDARRRFHSAYVFDTRSPAVTRVEVITEFRRAVLITERRLAHGDWIFGQGGTTLDGDNLESSLRPYRGRTAILAHVEFGPMNAGVTLPAFQIAVGPLEPLSSIATPLYSLPYTGPDGQPATHIVGADVETAFPADAIRRASWPVVVLEDGVPMARMSADFASLR